MLGIFIECIIINQIVTLKVSKNTFKPNFKCESCASKKERKGKKYWGHCEVCGQYEECYDTQNLLKRKWLLNQTSLL